MSDPNEDTKLEPAVLDEALVTKLIDELKAHLDEGLAEIEDKFNNALNDINERLSSLDTDKLRGLADEAKAAVATVAASGASDLASRVSKIEAQIKHFV